MSTLAVIQGILVIMIHLHMNMPTVNASPSSPAYIGLQRRSAIRMKLAKGVKGAKGAKKVVPATPQPAPPSPSNGKLVSLPLFNVKIQAINCNVTFGDGQVFKMVLDTGSSDTWILGSGCTSTDGSCDDATFLPDSTMKALNKQFNNTYGSGTSHGDIHQAPVTLGTEKVNLSIGSAIAAAGFTTTNGIVGLAFNSLSKISKATGQSANIMDALFGTSSNNIVSFYMPASSTTGLGQVTFGGVDDTKFTGKLTYVQLNSQTYWQIPLTGSTFAVNGVKGDFAGALENVIVDTGSSLIMIDPTVAAAVNQAIGTTGPDPTNPKFSIFESCESALQGHPLSITIGGATYNIPPSVYVLQMAAKCVSGITASATPKHAILGVVWVRAVYTTFDKMGSRVGFAQNADLAIAGLV